MSVIISNISPLLLSPLVSPLLSTLFLLIENLENLEQNPRICWINPILVGSHHFSSLVVPYETYPGSGSVLHDKNSWKHTNNICFSILFYTSSKKSPCQSENLPDYQKSRRLSSYAKHRRPSFRNPSGKLPDCPHSSIASWLASSRFSKSGPTFGWANSTRSFNSNVEGRTGAFCIATAIYLKPFQSRGHNCSSFVISPNQTCLFQICDQSLQCRCHN